MACFCLQKAANLERESRAVCLKSRSNAFNQAQGESGLPSAIKMGVVPAPLTSLIPQTHVIFCPMKHAAGAFLVAGAQRVGSSPIEHILDIIGVALPMHMSGAFVCRCWDICRGFGLPQRQGWQPAKTSTTKPVNMN